MSGPFETTRRIIRFGLQNYVRNGWLSIAATMIVAMTLFIVTVFTLNAYVTKETAKSIQDKLDTALYLNDNHEEQEVSDFIVELKAYPEIKEVVYLNKQQVAEEWNKFQVSEKIKSQVSGDNNPLPRTIKLKAHDPSQLDAIVAKIKESKYKDVVGDISYNDNRPLIQSLISKSNSTTKKGIIISAIFIVIAIVFVYHTIRIIIRFRQDEMGIMKLVGATDSFVQGPFIVEGALYGIIAGFITIVALYFYLQYGLTESSAALTSTDSLVDQQVINYFHSHFAAILSGLIAFAVLLAVGCSWISVRHHLKR